MKHVRVMTLTAALLGAVACNKDRAPEGPPPPEKTVAKRPCPKADGTAGKTEIRGVWMSNVGSDLFSSLTTLSKSVDQARAWGLNTLYPVAWNRGEVYFSKGSSKETLGTKAVTLGKLDILNEIIFKAHKPDEARLSVVPWFEYGLKIPYSTGDDALPIFKNHPDWFSRRQNGEMAYDSFGLEVAYLNPFYPPAQDFFIGLLLDVADNYEGIDGIQLDDNFSLPIDLGYDKFTTDLYRKETGQTAPLFMKSKHSRVAAANGGEPEWKQWTAWRTKKFSEFVARVSDAIRRSKHPNLKISIAVNSLDYASTYFLQDWKTWIDQGSVDELIIQNYRLKMAQFEGVISFANHAELESALACVPVGVGILVGTGARTLASSDLVENEIQTARSTGFDGVSFFHFQSLEQGPEGEAPERHVEFLNQLFRAEPYSMNLKRATERAPAAKRPRK